MFYKLMVLVSFQFLVTVLATKQNILINLPELNESQLIWNADLQEKIETLDYLLDALAETDGNVTLIGWQRVYKNDGSLSWIRTIELTVLTTALPEQSLSLEYVDTYAESVVVRDLVNDFESFGIWLHGSLNQYDTLGKSTNLIEVEKNNIKVYEPNLDTLLWKHTIDKDTLDSVQDLADNLEITTELPVALLHWDANGDFDSVNSRIIPEAVLTVNEATDANATVLDTVLEAVWKGHIVHSADEKSFVSNYLSEKIPEYSWLVSSDTISSCMYHKMHLEIACSVDILTTNVFFIYAV